MPLEDRIMRKIAEALGIDVEKINRQTAAADVVAWDSIGKMAILLAITDEFGIQLAPNETAKLDSVEGVIALVQAGTGNP